MPKNSPVQTNKNSEAKLRNETLGDFTTTGRVIPISALAMVIGLLCAFVALALLRLIGLFTNLFYFGRWNTSLVSPAGNVDVPIVLLVTKSGPILDLNLLGLRFQARQGGGSSSTQTFEILNTGDPLSTVSWTAEAIQGGDIFSLSPASGTATFSQPGEVTVSINV